MNNITTFTVQKKQLLNALHRIKKLEKSGKKKDSTLEVTVFDGYIRLNIPGIELIVQAFTSGSAKFTIRLWYFTDIVNSEKDKELQFALIEGLLKLRGFSFSVLTTFFESDKILRSINLPVNYKYLDIVRLYLSDKYTTEEISFNNLDKDVTDAIHKLNADIDKITSLMRKYGFTREDVGNLLLEKLNS